jgi:hypothetical protein
LGSLQLVDGGGGPLRCVRCGREAVGPCASCRAPVCGECCVLTEGGAKTWAICLACEDARGRSLRRGWLTVLSWILGPIVALALLTALLERLFGR